MDWTEIHVYAPSICREALSAIFYDLGSGGVVIDDTPKTPEDLPPWFHPEKDPVIDQTYCIVRAYFPAQRDITPVLEEKLSKLQDYFSVRCFYFTSSVREEDWEEAWKKYYHALRIGQKFIIKPSWEEYQEQPGDIVIEIDPGMAFGTGLHASTRFCLEFLEKYMQGGETVIDAGCGSGILALAAASCGAGKVIAVDLDEVAVQVSLENIRRNRLTGSIMVVHGDINLTIDTTRADFILANITADILAKLIPAAARALNRAGYFVGSGIIESEWEQVKRSLQQAGLSIIETSKEKEWIAVICQKT